MPNNKICPGTICTRLFDSFPRQTEQTYLLTHAAQLYLPRASKYYSASLLHYYTSYSDLLPVRAPKQSTQSSFHNLLNPLASKVGDTYKKQTYPACFLHSHDPVGLWCSIHKHTLPHLPAETQSGFLHMPPPWHFCHEWIHIPVVQEWWPGGCYLVQAVQKMSIPSIAFSLFSASHVSSLGKRNREASVNDASTQQVLLQR